MPQNHKNVDILIEEIGGDEFSSLAEAQQAALPFLVDDFVATMHRMIADGDLVIISGRLMVNRRKRR